MRRRDFITLLGGAATAWPVAARSQQALPVVGYLGQVSAEAYASHLRSFSQGLSDTGYVEGRNVTIEYAGRTMKAPLRGLDIRNWWLT
jgi:putative ABC transport system substrate-binding protein